MDNMTKFLKHFLYVPLAFVVLGILSSCGGGGGGGSSVTPPMTVTTAITSTVFSTTAIATATFAGDDYTVTLQAANAITSSYTTPTDFSLDYGLAAINADDAHKRGYFGEGVTVAIFGEGIRTTHIDLTANLISGVFYNTDGSTNTVAPIIDDSDSRGVIRPSDTFAAGIIAAANNNTLAHGIAPEASIIPLKGGPAAFSGGALGLGGSNGTFSVIAFNAFSYAADNGASILNNSWNAHPENFDYVILGGFYNGVDAFVGHGNSNSVSFYSPAFFDIPYAMFDRGTLDISDNFSEITAAITTADMALVWAAGDYGFNEETGTVILAGANAYSNIFTAVAVTSFLDGFSYVAADGTTISLATLSLDLNFAGGYALGPTYEPSLLGRWAHAVAVDSNSVIASFSNACGTDTKYWCLAAPGVDLTGLDRNSDDGVRSNVVLSNPVSTLTISESSTGYSAAYVSGALAVLKSRLPAMPMSVILALLFETATDLGETGVDDVYGHGLLNLERAITVQGNVGLVLSTYNTVTAFMTSAMTTAVTTTMAPPMTTTIAITNIVFSTTAIATTAISDYTVTLQAANTITSSYNTAAAVGYTLDYGLAQIGAHHAYERGYFGQGVTVAIFGEGIRTTHIDLTANLISGVYYNNDGSINTGSPIIDDSNSLDETRPSDTFAAGIIAAAVNNTLAHGIAPEASIIPLKGGTAAFSGGSPGLGASFSVIASNAFSYAANNGVHILNNSWNASPSHQDYIISGYYNGSNQFSDRFGNSQDIGFYMPAFFDIPYANVANGTLDISDTFSQITAAITTADMALVWAAGDYGFNEETGNIRLDDIDYRSNILTMFAATSFLDVFSYEATDGTTISLATLSLDINFAGGYAHAPLYEPSLLGRWVHAVAVDSNSVIASFSNACGTETRYWCLAAPGGEELTGLDRDSDDGVISNVVVSALTISESSTGYSAAYVSGALAVLKSRLPTMPMSVILALLFHTATDLGETGVDALYGHGLVNLEKAITVQGDIGLVLSTYTFITAFMTSTVSTVTMAATVTTAASANNNLLQSKSKVSPLLAALKEQLGEVSAAVEFLPGYYYNTPLGALIEVSEINSNLSNLGGAASSMLSQTQSREMGFGLSVLENKGTLLQVSHKTEFGRFTYDICTYCESSLWEEEQTNATPFFASNRPQMSYAAKLGELEFFAATGIEDTTTSNDYQQYGIRISVPKSEFGNAESGFLEFSRTTEEDTLYGGEYSGAFALSGSETYQGRLHTERSFTDDWRGMADYQFGWTNSEAQGGGLITDISRLRFDGYRIGVEGSSLFGVPFAGGGLMRFGITRQSGIRSGTIRLRYGVATTSEFIEDYQYALNNGYEVVEREFSLATRPTTLYHWGYTFTPRAQMQAAFGLEYNATANVNDSAAASLVLNWSY